MDCQWQLSHLNGKFKLAGHGPHYIQNLKHSLSGFLKERFSDMLSLPTFFIARNEF